MSKAAEPHPSFQPFQPVFKADAAATLHVCERTIDNYIQRGLLPKPTRFGLREMWHPNVFYGRLSAALLSGQTGADSLEHAVDAGREREPQADAARPGAAASGKLRREARLQALNQGSFGN